MSYYPKSETTSVKQCFSRVSQIRKAINAFKREKSRVWDEFQSDLLSESDEHVVKPEWTITVFKNNLRQQLLSTMRQLKRTNSWLLALETGNVNDFVEVGPKEANDAFLWAAFLGRLDLMMYFEEKGANVSFYSEPDNLNALHLTALVGSVQCCKWLLEKGCPFAQTLEALTPMHYAAMGNSKEVIMYFLSNDYKIPNTVINSAVFGNAVECVKFLLSLKIDANAYYDGMTALHVASDLRYIGCMEELLNEPSIDINLKTDEKGYTALHLAAENGYNDCIELLLSKHARINEINNKRQMPLHLACKMNNLDCVEILLKNRAFINEMDLDHKTPLHLAVSKSYHSLPVVEMLVRWKANVNVSDRYGYTPLHIAALNELEECATFLILNGANVAAETKTGLTALNIICRKTPKSAPAVRKMLTQSLAYNTEQSLKFSFREIITNSTVGEIGYLYTLQKEGYKELLQHPLCKAFLHLKWEKVKRYYFIRVLWALLTAFLLSFIVIVDIITNECPDEKDNSTTKLNILVEMKFANEAKPPIGTVLENLYEMIQNDSKYTNLTEFNYKINVNRYGKWSFECKNITNPTNCSNSSIENDSKEKHCFRTFYDNMTETKKNIVRYGSWSVLLILLVLNVIRILLCKVAYFSLKDYLWNFSNLVELILMLLMITIPILRIIQLEHDTKHTLCKLQKLVATLLVLLAWANLTLIIGQLPFFGTYITMFTKVLKELLKLLTVYSCLLMGFTLTFSTIKPERSKFGNPLTGFVRTMAMMSGEINFSEFTNMEEMKSTFHQTALYFVLTPFIILVTMALMNLLIGIAVKDVEGLQKTADISKLVHQTQLIYFLELSFFHGHVPKCLCDIFKKYLFVSPNLYRVVIYVRPLNPCEKRIPKDIMLEALEMAINKYKPPCEDKIEAIAKKNDILENKVDEIYKLLSKVFEKGLNEEM